MKEQNGLEETDQTCLNSLKQTLLFSFQNIVIKIWHMITRVITLVNETSPFITMNYNVDLFKKNKVRC